MKLFFVKSNKTDSFIGGYNPRRFLNLLEARKNIRYVGKRLLPDEYARTYDIIEVDLDAIPPTVIIYDAKGFKK